MRPTGNLHDPDASFDDSADPAMVGLPEPDAVTDRPAGRQPLKTDLFGWLRTDGLLLMFGN